MHPHCFFLALFALLVSLVTATTTNNVPGTWKPIDSIDLNATEIGEWALVFEKLISSEITFVSGTLYLLVVAAKDESLPNRTGNYRASVHDRDGAPRELIAFFKIEAVENNI
ncbi:cysteine proteinase inhibitor 5-like [Pyrus ussuriensis x Pyrus communis]|uniref:Cysteine proteinase inhibitor 5-like n=1 Tax=Pyrus ussuriensis x Pyrus communis TaxID=2448454 RepID=A0A5N5HR56_9ROSA|nr:cysteine proteinase inhibitor 5-like [Pyrus ussuriensis x Pyrus communis]